jgi:UDP-glucose 4-epimerase
VAVLVTRGAGYIGSATVEHLLARGQRVVVIDNLSRGHVAHPNGYEEINRYARVHS